MKNLYQEDYETMVKLGLSFSEALCSDQFNLIQKARLKQIAFNNDNRFPWATADRSGRASEKNKIV